MAQALVPVFASPYVVERPRLALILLRMLLLGTSRLQGDAEVSPALLDGLLHYALHDMAVLRQAARRVWVVMRVPLASYVPTAPATLPAMAQSRRRGSGRRRAGPLQRPATWTLRIRLGHARDGLLRQQLLALPPGRWTNIYGLSSLGTK